MNSEFSSVLAAQLVSSGAKWAFPNKPNFSPESLPVFSHSELKHHAESGYEARGVGCSPHAYPAAGSLHYLVVKVGLIVMHCLYQVAGLEIRS